MTQPDTGTVIAALRAEGDLQRACRSSASVLFDLAPDINTVQGKIKAAHAFGKKLFVHLDLAAGIGKDESGISFLKKLGVDGIISTRTNIIKAARENGLFTVQRFFIVDSHSIVTTLESLRASRADMIEIMPGILPRVIRTLRERTDVPIIAGGLIGTEADIREALDSGAVAVSTSREVLWEYRRTSRA